MNISESLSRKKLSRARDGLKKLFLKNQLGWWHSSLAHSKLSIMAPIEDEFKKRFKNQELANEDFDSQGNWDDSSNELELI